MGEITNRNYRIIDDGAGGYVAQYRLKYLPFIWLDIRPGIENYSIEEAQVRIDEYKKKGNVVVFEHNT